MLTDKIPAPEPYTILDITKRAEQLCAEDVGCIVRFSCTPFGNQDCTIVAIVTGELRQLDIDGNGIAIHLDQLQFGTGNIQEFLVNNDTAVEFFS